MIEAAGCAQPWRIDGSACFSVSTTVDAFFTTIDFRLPGIPSCRKYEPMPAIERSSEHFTALASTGTPLGNFRPVRSLNV
jgi:hypothetical protein